MPFDVGTIASVVVGGAISGGATIFTATRVQEAREKREAAREQARSLAAARAAARVYALDMGIVVASVRTAIKTRNWWPPELPPIPMLDDRKLLAEQMSREEWLAVSDALGSIPIVQTPRHLALTVAGRLDVVDHEVRILQLVLPDFERAHEVLRGYGSLKE